jgi:dTMP kinase
LEAGGWVLSDRFTDSTMAYQGYGLGLGREPVDRLRELVVGALDPDLTLILDLPVAEGLRRAAGRRDGGERYERMGRDFHQRLREGFLDIARREPGRCVVIDAGGAVEQVQDAVRTAVWRRWEADLP